ncbi:MAG: Asd/ArgC dimerization domain-containing protein, partial [Cetobacterium sp.]
LKMIDETMKIFNDYNLKITATTVRVPVKNGHSESINIEFNNFFELSDLVDSLKNAPGVIVVDNPLDNEYPTAFELENRDEVFVGRIRRDFSIDNGVNLWVVADNIRKGAATNAVQIAELLISYNLV